jgi:predicted RNA binding protein YcfA (HicA-like mRNA interferase family)
MKKIGLVKQLESAGYHRVRNGSHEICKKEGARSVQVPNYREINEYTAEAILKNAGLEKP